MISGRLACCSRSLYRSLQTTYLPQSSIYRSLHVTSHRQSSRHSSFDNLSPHQRSYLEQIKKDYEAAQMISEIRSSVVSQRYVARFSSLYNAYKEYTDTLADIDECLMLLEEEGMRDEVEREVEGFKRVLEESRSEIVNEISVTLAPSGDAIFLEISMAVGGVESSAFAMEMFNMYRSVAAHHGFSWTLLEEDRRGDQGLGRAVVEVTGPNVHGAFQFEAGVHRVQRVPFNDSRVHTSTVVVTVINKPQDINVQIDPEDLEIIFTTASGPGGQFVNRTHSKCRLHHKPSGIRIDSQESRDSHENKKICLQILHSRLTADLMSARDSKLKDAKKSQALQGDRSDKIRTYNYRSDRVTDHRYGESTVGIQEYLANPSVFCGFQEKIAACWQLEKLAAIAEEMGEQT